MFKDLLIKCCNLVGREDLSLEVENASKIDDILDISKKNEIINFFSYYNYVVCSIFENYLRLEFT